MSSIIEVKDLSFSYNKERKVLDNLSGSFERGRIIALIGKNGSGKSTFLDCLLGMNEYQGAVLIDGKNIKELSARAYAKYVSFIPQSVQINIDYSIRDFISFGRNPHVGFGLTLSEDDIKIIDANASKCGIQDLLEKDINKVSGGERQLAFIARALTQETPIIIMDEPTASLDFGNQQKLFKIVSALVEEGKTIIFTTHNPNHLVNLDCDIFAVSNGALKRIDALSKDIINELYGDEFECDGKSFLFKI